MGCRCNACLLGPAPLLRPGLLILTHVSQNLLEILASLLYVAKATCSVFGALGRELDRESDLQHWPQVLLVLQEFLVEALQQSLLATSDTPSTGVRTMGTHKLKR